MFNTIKVLFLQFSPDKKCEEYNFIMNEILPKYAKKEIRFIKTSDIDQIKETFDVFVYPCRNHKIFTYYGYAPVFEQVLELVKKINPKIIIQLKDESHSEYMHKHIELANYCKLFLKQFKHNYHVYPNNLIHIPLGYPNKFFSDINSLKMIKERKYFWSWCGYMDCRPERSDMINNFFNHIWKGMVSFNGSSDSYETSQMYRDSIFVPCPRGYYTLDCWRTYESIVSGAIPVVVGSLDEIQTTFDYTEVPPFICAETWYEASQKCVKLLEKYVRGNCEELQSMQDNLVKWWKNEMNYIQSNVYRVLFLE